MCMGIVGKVVEIVDPVKHTARVDVSGIMRNVNAALVDHDGKLQPGSYVLINVGLAVEILDEQEALESIRFLEEMERALQGEIPAAG